MALVNYDMNFKEMISKILGFIHRQPRRIAWLTACWKPLRTLHDEFLGFGEEMTYQARFNGQTIKLEKLMQDKFGDGIYITNHSVEVNGAFLGEGLDVGCYLSGGADNSHWIDLTYNIGQVNFTVHVPGSIVFAQSEMEAWINKYKMFGTTYEIVII